MVEKDWNKFMCTGQHQLTSCKPATYADSAPPITTAHCFPTDLTERSDWTHSNGKHSPLWPMFCLLTMLIATLASSEKCAVVAILDDNTVSVCHYMGCHGTYGIAVRFGLCNFSGYAVHFIWFSRTFTVQRNENKHGSSTESRAPCTHICMPGCLIW